MAGCRKSCTKSAKRIWLNTELRRNSGAHNRRCDGNRRNAYTKSGSLDTYNAGASYINDACRRP